MHLEIMLDDICACINVGSQLCFSIILYTLPIHIPDLIHSFECEYLDTNY